MFPKRMATPDSASPQAPEPDLGRVKRQKTPTLADNAHASLAARPPGANSAQTTRAPMRTKMDLAMKVEGRHGGQFPVGADPVVAYRVSEALSKKGRDDGRPVHRLLTAEQDANGKWVAGGNGPNAGQLLDGRYIFATMRPKVPVDVLDTVPEGTTAQDMKPEIRLGAAVNGVGAHAELTGNAKFTAYTGEAKFNQGDLDGYNNQSSTYVGSSVQRYRAGFGVSTGFKSVEDPIVTQDAASKAAAVAAASRGVEAALNIQKQAWPPATEGGEKS